MAVEVGAKVSGKVTGITNFGAFVDLGEGKTGLVHISEVSDAYVKDIHDVLTVGDTVTVKVMSIKDGKIGLSIRKAVDAPAGAHAAHGGPHTGAPHGAPHGAPRQGGAPRGNGGPSNFGRGPKPHRDNGGRGGFGKPQAPKDDFDGMMSGFLKESEDRLSSLRRNTEGKRGGRGGRRS
ncbi:S1 domain-containing RNA-binding protein [Lacticaseibacillus kribbianus]|uniref:S1 domain-containing RNA-binding protein n=1 Tax=Lacticaseibacillus kribbianus TaxID=2926292 RepID=UPI001CD1BCEE|nr:S1 domain-containing RNA-binding protein [Lacticaseibacillus kribbianus]